MTAPGRKQTLKLRHYPLRCCAWATTPLGIAYHDAEWGVPVHDDRVLFEFLILEGASLQEAHSRMR